MLPAQILTTGTKLLSNLQFSGIKGDTLMFGSNREIDDTPPQFNLEVRPLSKK